MVRRTGQDVPWTAGRDVWWHEITADQPTEHAAEAFDPPTRAFFTALGTNVLAVHADPATDVDGALTALLDGAGADALLLRPDRIVAASADRSDLRSWRRLLESAGISPRAESS